MSIYIWDSEITDLKIWDTSPSEVYVWDVKVRPTWPDKDYLCFTANTAGSKINMTKVWSPTNMSIETSTDGMIKK